MGNKGLARLVEIRIASDLHADSARACALQTSADNKIEEAERFAQYDDSTALMTAAH